MSADDPGFVDLATFLVSLPAVLPPAERGLRRFWGADRWSTYIRLDTKHPQVWDVIRKIAMALDQVTFSQAIWRPVSDSGCLKWELSASVDASPNRLLDALEDCLPQAEQVLAPTR